MNKEQHQTSPEEIKINGIKQELINYGEANKIKGMEGRIQRGLDPAGMLAIKSTREKIEKVAQMLGASMEDVIKMTNELHVGAIWNNADKLAKGDDPAIQTWMCAAEVTTSGKENERDLNNAEFLKDLERINLLLDEAVNDPKKFALRAKNNLVEKSKEQFKIEDGIPISEQDSGFLAMAVNGYNAGVVKDKGGLLFVGSNELDYRSLESAGLKVNEREDRGRKATFYKNDKDEEVVKKLYPGLAIILNGDIEVAKKLARTGEEKARQAKEKN